MLILTKVSEFAPKSIQKYLSFITGYLVVSLPVGMFVASLPPSPSLTEKLMREGCVATPSSSRRGSKHG